MVREGYPQTEDRLMVAEVGEEGMKSNCLMGTACFLRVEMFWNWIEAVVAQHCGCAKCHQIVQFKIVLHEFYFSLQKEPRCQTRKPVHSSNNTIVFQYFLLT